jgi:hypothetical protein
MKVPDRVNDELDYYHRTFRNASLQPLVVSDLYALFPDEAFSKNTKLHWPDKWPNADNAGVYLIFGEQLELLYVGKASNIDTRVSSYFRYTSDGTRRCEIKDSWKARPAFVATIAVDDDKTFEAAALEEYLITKLQPKENTRGVTENHVSP